jgi:hypothetical protein
VRPYYLNFVPGGIGQFQRGSIGKGTFFAVTQLATAATSAGIWLYLVQTYGYGGTVPREDAAFARRLQQIEIGTGVAFLGLVAWGIVDSLIHYKPQVQVRGDDSLLVPPPPKPAASAPPWRWHRRCGPTAAASRCASSTSRRRDLRTRVAEPATFGVAHAVTATHRPGPAAVGLPPL